MKADPIPEEGRVRIVESDSTRKERLEKFFTGWDVTHSVSVNNKPNRERTYSDDKPSKMILP
jgi:hypothetical protein